MEIKPFKDMGKEELGYSYSVNAFGTRGENYPLCKAMVNHNQQEIMAGGWRKISDKIDRELLKWKEDRRRNWREWGTCGMTIHFVSLTSGVTCDKGIDKRGEAWPPKVMFNNSFGAEVSSMSCSGGFMQRGDKRVAC